MAEDIFAEKDNEVTNEPEVKEEPTLKEDLVKGLMAERDPASVMSDPFAVDKTEAVDAVAGALDMQISKAARETGKKLASLPKDNIMIPIDKQNPHDQYVTVAINGFILRIQRGKKMALPRPMVDLLIAGGYGPTLVR